MGNKIEKARQSIKVFMSLVNKAQRKMSAERETAISKSETVETLLRLYIEDGAKK